MDQLELSNCVVRYDAEGNLEFNWQRSTQSAAQGQSQSSTKAAGPSPLVKDESITSVIPREEARKLGTFISQHAKV